MNKKALILLFSMIALVTGGLVTAGLIVTSEEEARPVFTGEYSLGPNDELAYVIERKGVHTLFAQMGDGHPAPVYQAEEEWEIHAPVFTGETEITFVETTGEPKEPPGKQEFQLVHSDVKTATVENGETTTVLDARGYITELLYDDAKDRLIVNGVHMSTEKKPEVGFIPYESALYILSRDGDVEKIRSFDAYSPGSLQITKEGEHLFMILPDDFEEVTPESMFEATERIYEMKIDDLSALQVVSKEDSDIPISEFVLVGDGTQMLYQTIMNWGEGGTYLYDTVWFDRSTKKEGKRLHINEAVMNAKLNEEGSWLYYVKMSQKADQTRQYGLYRFDVTGEKKEEKLNIEERIQEGEASS
ncbi:hypothetical protein [Alteribacillus iranensis]|uniref:Uncharacterized protein n=1 Tax=Alteribacillus iranensis TaxID=930128 RepID=A0A1I2D2B2_9BACI|nr:hypothetical protein [Alteribacillus iranensis]SFE74651.1 hypothetical protein SAMN05192532_103356 [Alteribacillus iranensis]